MSFGRILSFQISPVRKNTHTGIVHTCACNVFYVMSVLQFCGKKSSEFFSVRRKQTVGEGVCKKVLFLSTLRVVFSSL